MTTRDAVRFDPPLLRTPTGRLRAVVLAKPARSIENAKPLIGEPGTVHPWALEQHAVFCRTLGSFGVETIVLDAHGEDAYETCVMDAAVVFEDGATIMRPSALSRRAEADRMQAEFSHVGLPVAGHIAPPGLLDGTDVMLAGEVAFVGVGHRANALGRESFARAAQTRGYRVVEVKLADGVPCLRAVAAAVAKDTIVLGADKAEPAAFAGFRTIVLERGEELAAGVFCLSERHVLADLRYRTSLFTLRRAGITVEAIDLYEFGKIGITPSMLALALKRD